LKRPDLPRRRLSQHISDILPFFQAEGRDYNPMRIDQQIRNIADSKKIYSTFQSLNQELQEALSLYWDIATQVLHKSGINVLPPDPEYFSIERNFFSALFLYSYFRAGISESRRVLYTAMNQCLRGMVTGCDNILDNEYKKMIETNLSQQATRFRSILDIMVSDRVLFAILLKAYLDHNLDFDQIQTASFESLRTLAKSGAQEASEEGGISEILRPENILEEIHHYKTGILFQSPWALPEIIENQNLKDTFGMKNALYQIGMGCQILDDMADLAMDILMNRHNFVVSLIRHGNNAKESKILESLLASENRIEKNQNILDRFPDAGSAAAATALEFLETGTKALFAENHHFMVNISISFIVKRIGADRFLSDLVEDRD
jgi:hypothetical protein